jgi:hypothetical protein
MRIILLFFFLFYHPFEIFAQSSGRLRTLSEAEIQARKSQEQPLTNDSIHKAVEQLRVYADSMSRGSTDAIRNAYCALFNPLLLDILKSPISFDFVFDSLKTLSALKSSDGQVRIFTWFLQSRETGTFNYFGLIQKRNAKTGKFSIHGLMEKKHDTDFAEINVLKVDEWYGAVYYDIIERKINKKICYFLLGWQGHDRLSTRKVIEVLDFDFWDNVDFGMPVFMGQPGPKIKYRVVFEFAASAVMLLRYDKKKRMLVFDHLSPSSPSLKGNFSSYGPDFTYDGYRFRKGKWIYRKNLDLRN